MGSDIFENFDKNNFSFNDMLCSLNTIVDAFL